MKQLISYATITSMWTSCLSELQLRSVPPPKMKDAKSILHIVIYAVNLTQSVSSNVRKDLCG